MHILQISNDFGGTPVYKNLYQNLDILGIKQTIFVPLNPRVSDRKNKHDFKFLNSDSSIIYSEVQKKRHRYLYSSKIKLIVKDLRKKVDLTKIDVIHANNLCVTGAVAYEIAKEFNIPIIVAIRMTDVSYFRMFKWKKSYFHDILKFASKVVYISPKYKLKTTGCLFDRETARIVLTKALTIPNGIDSYFLKNIRFKHDISEPIKIIFAGVYSERKNLLRLIKAVKILSNKKYNVVLYAVGKDMPNRKVSEKYFSKIQNEVKGHEEIKLVHYMKKGELIKAYREADIFALPSLLETFGLVYIEALTQGLPIVYTKDQGFDGFYDDGYLGYGVDALDVNDIVRGLEKTIKNYRELARNITEVDFCNEFSWHVISKKYKNLYSAVIKKKRDN